MRKQFPKTVTELMDKNEKIVVLLGDIGVNNFSSAMKKYPKRVFNIGILEQSTIGLAAGLSLTGHIPIVHTIAPFLVERSYEYLKNDFGYQNIGGNFVSIGASYDYSALGCTHHCPADVNILKQIPNMEIIVPGTAEEFDLLFKQTFANGRPTYYRLSERKNTNSQLVKFGKAEIIKKGKKGTVVAIGPILDKVINATKGMDLTILYYTTVAPFDSKTLKENCPSGKILLCEPYYGGALTHEIISALSPRLVRLENLEVPKKFLTNYGKVEEHDEAIGLTTESIKNKIHNLIYE